MKILLIEDNRTIGQQIVTFLEGHQWSVDYADTGELGIQLAIHDCYDLILLDLNLPDKDGIDVCQTIKKQAQTNVPILMITARDHFDDKAQGFYAGADDYLTKPFDLRELVLRCQALSRRQQLHLDKQLTIGELVIDVAMHQACRNQIELQLTNVGFKILLLLAQSFPKPVPRSKILHTVWGDELPDSDALKSHIYSLRNVLDKPFEKPMLKTITNVGYQLVTSNE
ncbi:response regulator transcription factor [Aliikangiella marina]|uniref:response regulator transcription factor n=1 Tax=Aliikangiella marina TaxID=1712262 RepID=UPI001FEC6BE1|nr:response regulator transcription factor [Aliikangiella marina]